MFTLSVGTVVARLTVTFVSPSFTLIIAEWGLKGDSPYVVLKEYAYILLTVGVAGTVIENGAVSKAELDINLKFEPLHLCKVSLKLTFNVND